MPKPKITLEVITEKHPAATFHEAPQGWGDNAHLTRLDSRPSEITVMRNGEPVFGINVRDDGGITFTSYGHSYQMYVEQQFRLYPTRPWKKGMK